jgi:outer membrane murein-binding lipoprotein Lpp
MHQMLSRDGGHFFSFQICWKVENLLAAFWGTQVEVQKIREIIASGGLMNSISKWFAAAILSTSLIFTGNVAEAKKKTKHKTHASHVHKKVDKKKKKRSAQRSTKRSEGYAKASRYMEREPASVHAKKIKKSKHKMAKKKKHRKHSA